MNAPSDTILIDRMKVNKMLHLSRNASYRLLPRTRFAGRVAMVDVRALLKRKAENGAVWGGGELVEVSGEAFGVSQRSLFRVLKTAPHFRISRKIALIEADKMDEFITRK